MISAVYDPDKIYESWREPRCNECIVYGAPGDGSYYIRNAYQRI